MKKLNRIVIIWLAIILSSGCSKPTNNKHNGFFAWMDAYIAIEQNTENAIAVTLFFENEPFEPDDVASITFVDISKDIPISNFGIEDTKQSVKHYSSYAITLNYTANTTGIYETSGIVITLKSNEAIKYPIGKWIFDVNEESADIVDVWSSPVATANGKEFPYEYSVIQSTGKITKIHYGDQLFINDDSGLDNMGIIPINNNYSSPIVYIKSKIIVSINGEDKIDFGEGSYCGAIGSSEDIITASKERNGIR
ncbi:hypothetical protein H1230_27800 [Paenibacillus sp. 19GGS1-52]|uniref:hypothetical protein n=1 Tax=Paenibacillus sp. 19GGS1-52 TaxID=2758563 RepID=UPI001EFA9A79|nr:hypothetical protein [Paenibacillus sp. 19GGS1-52]ULO06747.1 hypothetical protein H1230_27800 [Paenibacillus sp. 19GGS1-52]